jgi:hypothetical protein
LVLCFFKEDHHLREAIDPQCTVGLSIKPVALRKPEYENLKESANLASDQRIIGSSMKMFYDQIDKNQHPIGFNESIRNNYGGLKDPSSFEKYAANMTPLP